MNLKLYKKKRNFNKTAEPAGDRKKSRRTTRTDSPATKPRRKNTTGISPKQLIFVVQKHHARRLHYDLRLERDGVLKSWAVPKGPSLNPEDKRLAIMVEDHPYEYKDFEGVIPAGNYGAGKVIIWDKGTYEPVGDSSIEKGHFNFKLNGKKLKGEFALIKLKNKEKNEWLLIKKTPKKSRSAFKKIPVNLKPMLARLLDKPFTRQGWIFEIKWDGYRILANIINNTVKLISRSGKDYTSIYQPVSDDLTGCNFSAVLDGEIVILDPEGYSHFQLLQDYQQNHRGQLMYMVFDILWLNGSDLRQLPLLERKKILSEWLPNMAHVRISEYITTAGVAFYKTAVEHNLEGIMAKDGKSPYLSGQRSPHWLKIKVKQKINAIIIGFTQPRGSRRHLGALILAQRKNKKLTYIGHTAGKLTENKLAELKKKFSPYIITAAPLKNPPKTNMPVTWLQPVFHAEIEFSEWTEAGHLRQPIFNKLLAPATARKLEFTHLDKIYWPAEGYTKKDLIEYYRQVSTVILPYLKDRPEVLHRYPEGINGESFYQKNAKGLPEWIKTKVYYSEHAKKEVCYLLCQNQETLLFMANLGCIEMNPWLSRINFPDNPEYCVLDLDPVNTAFIEVIQVAKAIGRILAKLDITGFCKTSGKRGLHIYIPLKPHYNFDQSKQFAEIIAILVQLQLPGIVSLERRPSKRQGKVYVDFLQNRPRQTVVSAYSVRPVPGATVSTPIRWSELNKRLDPHKFTIKNIHKRLDKFGDLWENMQDFSINIDIILNKIQKIFKMQLK